MIKDINDTDPQLLKEDERIALYLKGKMSAEEEEKFLKELEEYPKLKEKAIITARLVKGLKEVGSERDRDIQQAILASSEQDMKAACEFAKQGQSKAAVASMKPAAKWLSIAASLICIVWLGLSYYSYRNTTALGNQYDTEFSTGMITRGQEGDSESKVDEKLQKLFTNVTENKDLDEAIHDLSIYWELSTMDTYNDFTDYSAEIGWKLAIAHLKNNDKKGAKAVLEKLISTSEEGSAVNEKAKELVEKL